MKACVIQLQSQIKKDKNLSDALDIAKDAIEKEQPDLIAFPEMFAFNGGTTEQKNSLQNIFQKAKPLKFYLNSHQVIMFVFMVAVFTNTPMIRFQTLQLYSINTEK